MRGVGGRQNVGEKTVVPAGGLFGDFVAGGGFWIGGAGAGAGGAPKEGTGGRRRGECSLIFMEI